MEVTDNLKDLANCDIILANRIEEDLEEFKDKIFSRDIFGEN